MRLLKLNCIFFVLFSLNGVLSAVHNIVPQDMIEVGPIKELPPDSSGDRSAELENQSASINMVKGKGKVRDIDVLYGQKPMDDEAKIEQELADLYKDTDYNSGEKPKSKEPKQMKPSGRAGSDDAPTSKVPDVVPDTTTNVPEEAPEDMPYKKSERAGDSSIFQPKSLNQGDVERFKTSVDALSCDKYKLTTEVTDQDKQEYETSEDSTEAITTPSGVPETTTPEKKNEASTPIQDLVLLVITLFIPFHYLK